MQYKTLPDGEKKMLEMSSVIENAPYALHKKHDSLYAGNSKGASSSSSHSSNSSSHSSSSSKNLEGKL